MTSSEGERYHGKMRNSSGQFNLQKRFQNFNQNFFPNQNFQKQVSFQLASNGPNKQINYLSHVPSQNSVLNKNKPNKGQAFFNNSLVNYMGDSGADITVIDVKTYFLINRHEPTTILEEYHGGKLYSASGKIKIFGLVRLKRCLIVPGVQFKKYKYIDY
ncbi:unnamed protein product [Brachionus calyciflorus]|uniref:Peptidase A2 domain-containing protein n=1 Tax=Brachionus calyciflorus TaxID=104777 RepID=A0A814DXI2_9BILA|nr:unnamed protein product [Brachionus calyciflorus]